MKINLIKASLFTPTRHLAGTNKWVWGLPLLIEDEPGCAKSAVIKQLAEEWGLPYKWLSPGAHGEGQFGVVPVCLDGRLSYPRPDWTDQFIEDGRGLILVDEITSCFTPDTHVTVIRNGQEIEVPIASVLEGETVLGANLETGEVRYNTVTFVTPTEKPSSPVVSVRTKNGKEIKATADHRFFTARGWITAGNLCKGDKLCNLPSMSESIGSNNQRTFENTSNVNGNFSNHVSKRNYNFKGNTQSKSNEAISNIQVQNGNRSYISGEDQKAYRTTGQLFKESNRRTEATCESKALANHAQNNYSRTKNETVFNGKTGCDQKTSEYVFNGGQEGESVLANGNRSQIKEYSSAGNVEKRIASQQYCTEEFKSSNRGENSSRIFNSETNSEGEGIYRSSEQSADLGGGGWNGKNSDSERRTQLEKSRFFGGESEESGASRQIETNLSEYRNTGLSTGGLEGSAYCVEGNGKFGSSVTENSSIHWDEVISVIPNEYTGTVYDLTTTPDHNFFVNGVLVHNCDVGLQPPMLGMVNERVIGTFEFPPGVRIIGACNPPHLAANGHDVSAPLANRFGWLTWGAPSVSEHLEYMMGKANNGNVKARSAEVEERRVLEMWPDVFAKAVGLEAGFLRSHGDMKNKCPGGNNGAQSVLASRAWPSDRTWEMATRALAASYVHGLTDVERDEFVSAFIGQATYQAWATWMESADLPDSGDLLDGKKTNWKPTAKRLDRAAAVLSACTSLLLSDNDKQRQGNRTENMWKLVVGPVIEFAPDVVAASGLQLIKNGLVKCPSAAQYLAKLNPMMEALKSVR